MGISAPGRLIEIRRATLAWTAATLILVLAWAGVLVAGRIQGNVLVVTLVTIWLPAFVSWLEHSGSPDHTIR